MTEIYLSDGRKIEKEHVSVKANGWVKAYDAVEGNRPNKEYENLTHYPPHEVEAIHGKAIYQSPHGAI